MASLATFSQAQGAIPVAVLEEAHSCFQKMARLTERGAVSQATLNNFDERPEKHEYQQN